jgi:4-hydroxy-tetrahydrodipicolinate synthase
MTLQGLYTAIITPFDKNGDIDVAAFKLLLDHQLDGGVDGIVVGGSTGEAATLTLEEKRLLWSTACDHVEGRVPIIAGSGSNDTAASVAASKVAQECGARALLVVTPYYNKPTPAGLEAHHAAIADAVDLPQILYNVPGRSALNMSAELQLKLMEQIPTIIATKEASANLEQISEIAMHAPSHVRVLAGDDSLALPIIAVGGSGVIAVISNYAPKTFGTLVRASLHGDLSTARTVQKELMPWFKANFLESNPIPVKYIVHRKLLTPLTYRLPLVAPTSATRSTIDLMMSTLPH